MLQYSNSKLEGAVLMSKEMGLVAFYLPKIMTRGEVEEALGILLKKRIEATYYAQLDNNALITYTQFNVIAMINLSRNQIVEILKKLNIQDADRFDRTGLYQDYPLFIDPEIDTKFSIDNNAITLKESSLTNLVISAYVVSQSVALELYEQKLADYFEKSRHLIDSVDTYSMFKRSRMARFAKELVMTRHDMVIDLHLLDKPNILWDNEDAEMLYNSLASSLELKDRFDIVEYKLNSIKDDMMMVMDLTNHNHSSFLEWIIIGLIALEIFMGLGLFEWLKP